MFFPTCLTDLIKNRQEELALERIQKNQEVNSRTFWGHYTPLHIAIETNQPRIIDALLKAHANVNAITYRDWFTPLHVAANCSDLRTIEKLLTYDTNLNEQTYHEKNTALHIVVRQGLSKHAEALIEAQALLDTRNSNGDTALHIAAKQGNMQIMLLLLDKGASCNIPNNEEQTPLFLAMVAGHTDCYMTLIKRGANFESYLNGVRKLQENYDKECKRSNKLNDENVMLRAQVDDSLLHIQELMKKIDKMQAMIDNMPITEAVDNIIRYGKQQP